jgi:hypothetical protein
MVVPSVFFSLLYSYSTGFRRYLFDATVVLVITFLGSAIAATLVPWRAKGLYQASPMVDYKILGVPLISIAGGIFAGSLSFALILWMRDSVYGVNYRTSLIYMGVLYLVSAAIYIVARVVRDRQGMSLSGAQKQIPSD